MKSNILVVDDDPSVIAALKELLQDHYNPITVTSGAEALEKVKKHPNLDLVLLDITMPDMNGIDALRHIKELDSQLDAIMVSANNTAEAAVKTIRIGAYDYVTKPFNNEDLIAVINRALEKRQLIRQKEIIEEEKKKWEQSLLIGKSPVMQNVYSLIDKVADADSTVLIFGESGTGKELVARELHKRGIRNEKPFVAVNCAAIPGELVESEFFGHEKGAFTSASARKIGKFEYADGGIIFLDDVGELPLPIQAKLLRVLQEREIVRVGANEVIPVDVRVVAATNVDLRQLVEQRRFREDLYFRLKVVPVEIPPLRARREDVPLLVDHFISKLCVRHNKIIKKVQSEAMNLLANYNWPGNVRELENMLEMVVLLATGDVIQTSDLPSNILTNQALKEPFDQEGAVISLKEARHQFEKQFILRVLEKLRWNQSKAARVMGIHRNTLILKMEELGIKRQ
ncbi:MAG: sigma-54 dependent transcriptional regulator [candidate division FCPU426 bacterium]